MAAFKRRSTKKAEDEILANESEAEASVETAGAEEAQASETDSGDTDQTADTDDAAPKKRRAVVKKSADQGNFKAGASGGRSFTPKKSFSRNIPQEVSNTETHLPENMQDSGTQPRLEINELTKKGMQELRELAIQYGFTADDLAPMKKQDLIFVILKAHTEHGGIIFASGALEILPDGYGFLRSPQNSYLPGPDDIYISPSQIRLFNLKTGDTVYGQTRSPKEGEKFFALLRIETVNFDEPRVAQTRVPFENLTPLYPDEKLKLETVSTEVSTRIVDLFAPIGKGQQYV